MTGTNRQRPLTEAKPDGYGMAYQRKQKGEGLYMLVKSMSDADLATGLKILQAEQEKRTRERFTPIQPFGALATRHNG